MAKGKISWYRVELGKSGAVVSVRKVEERSQGDTTVLFVRARSDDEAGKTARAEYRKMQQRIQRKRYAAANLCNCGGIRIPGKLQCVTCKARADRYNAKRHGTPAPPPAPKPERPPVPRPPQPLSRTAELRLAVLEEVAQRWQDTSTNGEFTKWLTGEIAKLRNHYRDSAG